MKKGKISNETINFLKDNPEGNIKELPSDLKHFFINSKEFDEKTFNEIYNFSGDVHKIKKNMILYDSVFGNEFTVNNIVIGSGVAFIDVEEHEEAMMISEVKDERFRSLKIKE